MEKLVEDKYGTLVRFNAFRHGGKGLEAWFAVPLTGNGDYVGGTLEGSNRRALQDELSESCASVRNLAHGYTDLVVCPARMSREDKKVLCKYIEMIEEYPIYDEEIWAEVSLEWENEALEWVEEEFVEKLQNIFKTDIPLDGYLDHVIRKMMEQKNMYFIEESGGMWVDVEELLEGEDRDSLLRFPVVAKAAYEAGAYDAPSCQFDPNPEQDFLFQVLHPKTIGLELQHVH
jgi:hypothetical protein